MPPERQDRCWLASWKRHCSKYLLQLGRPLPENSGGSDLDTGLRSSWGSLTKTGRVFHWHCYELCSGQHTASQMQKSYLDSSYTIEVAIKNITICISNDADPVLLTRTFLYALEVLMLGDISGCEKEDLFWRFSGRGTCSRNQFGMLEWTRRWITFSTNLIQRRPIWKTGVVALPIISARIQFVYSP